MSKKEITNASNSIKDICGDHYFDALIKILNFRKSVDLDSKICIDGLENSFIDALVDESFNESLSEASKYVIELKDYLSINDSICERVPRFDNIVDNILEEVEALDSKSLDQVSDNLLSTVVINRVKKRNTKSGKYNQLIPLIFEPLISNYVQAKKKQVMLNYGASEFDDLLYACFIEDRLSTVLNEVIPKNYADFRRDEISLGKKKSNIKHYSDFYKEELLTELVKPEGSNLLFDTEQFLAKNKAKALLLFFDAEKIKIYNEKLAMHLLDSFDSFFGIEGAMNPNEYNAILEGDLDFKEFSEYSSQIWYYLIHENVINILINSNGSHGTFESNGLLIPLKNKVASYFEGLSKQKYIYEGKGKFKYFEDYARTLCKMFSKEHKEVIIKNFKKDVGYNNIKNLLNDYCALVNSSYNSLTKLMIGNHMDSYTGSSFENNSESWMTKLFENPKLNELSDILLVDKSRSSLGANLSSSELKDSCPNREFLTLNMSVALESYLGEHPIKPLIKNIKSIVGYDKIFNNETKDIVDYLKNNSGRKVIGEYASKLSKSLVDYQFRKFLKLKGVK